MTGGHMSPLSSKYPPFDAVQVTCSSSCDSVCLSVAVQVCGCSHVILARSHSHSTTGLHDLIPDNLLGIFDENELEVYRTPIILFLL